MTVPALRELAATPNMKQLITHFSEPGGAGEARRLSEENAVRASKSFNPRRAEEGDVGFLVGEAHSWWRQGGQNSVLCKEPQLPGAGVCLGSPHIS